MTSVGGIQRDVDWRTLRNPLVFSSNLISSNVQRKGGGVSAFPSKSLSHKLSFTPITLLLQQITISYINGFMCHILLLS